MAGRGGAFDLEEEFGVPAERIAALDRVTELAIAAGIDALRDAGIPLVMKYKTTSKGTQLPDRWMLPGTLRDDTGVIFASAFPGYDSFAKIMADYYADHAKREQLAMLGDLRLRVAENNGHSILTQELDRRIAEMRAAIESQPFVFDRRFLFRVLSMGHSQFAEYIGARGPNTQVNAACASTTQAVGIAEDWIHAGRCRRVIVVSADDITSDNLIDWMGAGFLASGAAATDDVVEEAAIPFDRRRHGMIIGMGGAALVVESSEAAKERGLQPICEVLSAVTANSAFHGTRLDVQHISQVMEDLIGRAEKRCGIDRRQIANRTVFVSHETYTPARGGSASAEIHALRHVFGDAADQIVIANTKGFTGHAMATGIEDVVAVKALETACVPPVPNFQEVDPELGRLNLAKGGMYPVEYALRLGAGFGSQISMTLMRWTATKDGSHRNPSNLGYSYRIADQNAWSEWLAKVAGQKAATLEVVRHTLRVKDENARIATAKPNGDEILSTRVPRMASQDVETARVTRSAPAHVATQSSVAPERVAPAAVSASIPSTDEVKDRVLGLVAAKTGYPVDMLDLDLDLEADLGIDTVKQAEVFAAIREDYGITRDNQLKLRDFPTLAHVIGFVYDRRPELEKPAPSPRVETKPEIQTTASHSVVQGPKEDAVQERILTLVMEKTGYPKDMLDLDLDLEADLGIDTVKQAEMFAAIREIYNIPRDENRKLRDYPTLSHVIRFVYEKRSDLAGTSQTSTIVSQGAVEQPTVAAGNENSIDDVTGKVLAIVSEKTGYPKEMLDLDLDLEADLGIDTVKQAEMFAAVRAAYDIPRDENLKLRDFPTLAHVIKFAVERRTAVAASPRSAATPAQTAERPASPRAQGSVPDALVRPIPVSFDAANRIPRRVPVAKLRPALSVFKTTGVTLTPGRRIAIMPDLAGVGEALAAQAQKSGAEVLRIDRKFNANELDAQLKTWLASGGIDGVYWLPALDDEGPLSNMGLSSWREAVRIRTKLLYVSMRALYEQIAKPGTFLITATRLGGQHGYDEAGAMAPLGGAVTGFTKAYKRERPDALVKAIDFTSDATISQISEVLIEETLLDPGIVEIGYKYGERWTCALEEQPATDGQPGLQLDSRSVFLITGAAGSIVSAITADLAAASGGTFYLLDVVPEPDPNNADLKQFVSDKEALKRELFNRIQARGERATPALVEKELAGLERALAARTAIDAARAAGGTARYFSVDLTNGDAVAKIINDVRQRSGRIDVLLHAAGVERSHLLKDKDTREFDLVFDVKADGFFNLLHAIADMPLGSTVAFSSIAGRFGNAGQTDYSSANDLLCKITSSLRRTRPDTRAIAIDWTAWGGIGMATRGSIPKMMEAAGIDMLTAEAGIPTIRRELTSGGTRGEVVIAQGLGVLLNEWEAGGGIEVLAKEAAARGAMIGNSITVGPDHSISIETELSPVEQPFLHDHQIDGTPVLPGVMGVEAFAEAAALLFPALTVASVENVNFVAPFKFYRNEPRTVSVRVRPRWEENAVLADCELLGSRILPNQKEPQVTTHFTGTVRLTKELSTGATARPIGTPTGQMIDAKLIYGVYFHGPAYQVLERGWWNGIRMIGLLNDRLPANHHPPNLKLMLAPRLIELCFQTAGLWELGVQGRMGLPLHIHQVRLERNPEQTEGRLYATVTPDPDNGGFDVEVIDAAGIRYMHVTGYRTVALPQGADSEALKSLQTAMSLQAVAA
ncbi:MAG TPA: SDR family oxidoreductase [Terriglobales bacterium]|nr:SDR family oxidoreductase [Terriglobales bacterium]